MTRRHPDLIRALRETAARLERGARYEWGHMGRCNAGHLIQTLTALSDRQIAETADHMGEWTEHAQRHCSGTGMRIDDIFAALHEVGFGREDVIQLEHLSNPEVLRRLGGGDGPYHLHRNDVRDVITYLRALADMLAEEA